MTSKWSKPKLQYPVAVDVSGARHFEYSPVGDHSLLWRKCPEFRRITVPCGKCNGCRMDNTRMWALRMMHESRYHHHNYFITLTYAPEFLPKDADLNYRDLRLFC